MEMQKKRVTADTQIKSAKYSLLFLEKEISDISVYKI